MFFQFPHGNKHCLELGGVRYLKSPLEEVLLYLTKAARHIPVLCLRHLPNYTQECRFCKSKTDKNMQVHEPCLMYEVR